MRWHYHFYLSFVLLFIIGCQSNPTSTLRIATASNMQFAMKDLVDVFQQRTGIHTELIIGSSGKLTAQIIEGAPYDILVSADMKYPNEIHEQGLSKLKPQVYALGKLVIWSQSETKELSLNTLSDPRIKHIATANSMTAPYGRAAADVIQRLEFKDDIQDKLVFGESISQVNQFIISQSAEIGFTSLSTVLAQDKSVKGVWHEIDTTLYAPIDQGVILINRDMARFEQAQQFYTFLFSPEAKTILKDFGYSFYE